MSEEALSVIDRLRIFQIRGQAVVLDGDLAAVYGVSTSNFNKAIRRNRDRFPADFCFQAGARELADLKFQIGTSTKQNSARSCSRRPASPKNEIGFHTIR